MSPSAAFSTVWGVWAASWIVAALWSAPTIERRSFGAVWYGYALIGLAILIPPVWHGVGLPVTRWWSVGYAGAYGLAAATVPGFAFAWWARIHLGALWSGAITRKADHRVVETGPYGWVRHPIYTGILWAALVTDCAAASLPACASFAALLAGFWLKARAEEGFLAEQLGAERYEAYRRRVPMLLPLPRP